MGLLRRPAPDSLWRNRDFNLLWGGQALSSLGSAMADLAFPLLVLALTGSPVAAGWVGTIALTVQVVVSLPSGFLVDRVNRRPPDDGLRCRPHGRLRGSRRRTGDGSGRRRPRAGGRGGRRPVRDPLLQ